MHDFKASAVSVLATCLPVIPHVHTRMCTGLSAIIAHVIDHPRSYLAAQIISWPFPSPLPHRLVSTPISNNRPPTVCFVITLTAHRPWDIRAGITPTKDAPLNHQAQANEVSSLQMMARPLRVTSSFNRNDKSFQSVATGLVL